MAYTFTAVRLGSAPKVHLGVSYSEGAKYVTRCAAGRLRAADPTDEPITCFNCLTRYGGDLYLYRTGRTRATAP